MQGAREIYGRVTFKNDILTVTSFQTSCLRSRYLFFWKIPCFFSKRDWCDNSFVCKNKFNLPTKRLCDAVNFVRSIYCCRTLDVCDNDQQQWYKTFLDFIPLTYEDHIYPTDRIVRPNRIPLIKAALLKRIPFLLITGREIIYHL